MGEVASSVFKAPIPETEHSSRRRVRCDVLGAPIDVVSWPEAVDRIASWAKMRQSRMVVLCNVHSVVTVRSDPEFAAAIERAAAGRHRLGDAIRAAVEPLDWSVLVPRIVPGA